MGVFYLRGQGEADPVFTYTKNFPTTWPSQLCRLAIPSVFSHHFSLFFFFSSRPLLPPPLAERPKDFPIIAYCTGRSRYYILPRCCLEDTTETKRGGVCGQSVTARAVRPYHTYQVLVYSYMTRGPSRKAERKTTDGRPTNKARIVARPVQLLIENGELK